VADAPNLADVLFVEHMGNETYLYLDNNMGEPWVVRNAERSAIEAGQTIGYRLPPEHCHLFGESGQAFTRRIVGDSVGRGAGEAVPIVFSERLRANAVH
jgi:multiple sugar transport system ATP-binding protein